MFRHKLKIEQWKEQVANDAFKVLQVSLRCRERVGTSYASRAVKEGSEQQRESKNPMQQNPNFQLFDAMSIALESSRPHAVREFGWGTSVKRKFSPPFVFAGVSRLFFPQIPFSSRPLLLSTLQNARKCIDAVAGVTALDFRRVCSRKSQTVHNSGFASM